MTRFKLRTFLILAAVLPAAFGMLWRCGQLDYEYHPLGDTSGGVRQFRICRLELECNGPFQMASLRWVQRWIHRDHRNYQLPPFDQEFARDNHPWNSREWVPFMTGRIVCISVGDAVANFAPKAPDLLTPASRGIAALLELPAQLIDDSEPTPPPPAP